MAFRSKSIFGIALVAAVFAAANGSGEKPKASPPPQVVEVSPVSREEALIEQTGWRQCPKRSLISCHRNISNNCGCAARQ